MNIIPCVINPFCIFRYMKRLLNGGHYALLCGILFLFRPHFEHIEEDKIKFYILLTIYSGFIYGFHLDVN